MRTRPAEEEDPRGDIPGSRRQSGEVTPEITAEANLGGLNCVGVNEESKPDREIQTKPLIQTGNLKVRLCM